jgi:hypothetical protein
MMAGMEILQIPLELPLELLLIQEVAKAMQMALRLEWQEMKMEGNGVVGGGGY